MPSTPRRATRKGTRANSGVKQKGLGLDARLPPGLLRERPGFKPGGRFYIADRQTKQKDRIVVANKDNPRIRYHEKAHYIWERRMTPKLRKEWKDDLEVHLANQRGVTAKKAKQVARSRSRIENGVDKGSDAEELFAVTYAEYKLGRMGRNGLARFMERNLGKGKANGPAWPKHRLHRPGLALTIFGLTPITFIVMLTAYALAGHAGVEYLQAKAASVNVPSWIYQPMLPDLGMPWALATTPPALFSIACTLYGVYLMRQHQLRFIQRNFGRGEEST